MRSAVHDDRVLAKLLRQDRAIVVVGAVAITLLGWAYLFYQGWAMQHMDLVAMAMPSTGAWGLMDLLVVFVMWAVMMVAMMVPSAIPMLLTFATVARGRRAQGMAFVPVWVLLGGYLVSWTAFSLAATLAQWGLRSLALISPMMVGTSPVLGGVLLIAVGIYQWTPFKQACLTHCRTPLQFLLTYWQDGTAGAFLIGLRHGAYCLGCCWLLMAVLFAVGVMNLAWIAALSVFVLLEKIIPRGLWVSKLAGLALMGFGGWIALSGGT
jgi:predicted metal-binding membrane protein